MLNNFDDIQKLGQNNLDVTMKSLSALTKSTQAIATEMVDYSKKSFEDGSKALEKLFGAKTLEQAVEIQTDYAKSGYEAFMTGANKIGELCLDCAREAYMPFESHLTKAAPSTPRK